MAVSVVLRSAIRFPRSARNAARKRTSRSFPNSEGWKRNGPRSIQRRVFRTSAPKTGAITSIAIMTTYTVFELRRQKPGPRSVIAAMPSDPDRRVERLARDVVVRVGRVVSARDPVDRPEPVGDERRDREQQHPVEIAQERGVARAGPGPGGDSRAGCVVDHQSVLAGATTVACLSK